MLVSPRSSSANANKGEELLHEEGAISSPLSCTERGMSDSWLAYTIAFRFLIPSLTASIEVTPVGKVSCSM